MNSATQSANVAVESANDAIVQGERPQRPVITVATIIEDDGRFLVIEEETRAGLRLNQPAGHVEVGESIAAAAARETLEEAAWRVDPVALVGVYHWQSPLYGTYVRFTFAAEARAHEPARPLDRGIVRAMWLTYDEIAARRATHRSPFVLRSLDDYRAGRRWPLGIISGL
jgi:8-oxo-dGTP pyrophosphatase MutT (NUDIX family)